MSPTPIQGLACSATLHKYAGSGVLDRGSFIPAVTFVQEGIKGPDTGGGQIRAFMVLVKQP